MKTCPKCGYSAAPKLYKSQRKHFDAHAYECTRCLYRIETQSSEVSARVEWDRMSDQAWNSEVNYGGNH